MPIKFKYQPAGAIVGLAAYAAGQSKARERALSGALSGRRYPRTSQADTEEIGGRWVDPLDQFEGPDEALQQARIQQRAQMKAVGRDPGRAQRYGSNNLLPRWQSGAQVKQIQEAQKEATEQATKQAGEVRTDTRAWRRAQLSSMFSDLPKIPEHTEGDDRRRLEGLLRDINKARYSRDLDPTDDDKFDQVAALVKEYNEAVGAVPPANPNQYGYVLNPETKKLEPAGEQMAEYEWKPGMTSPVETEWFRNKRAEDAAKAELDRTRADAAEKERKAADAAAFKERKDVIKGYYDKLVPTIGSKSTGIGPKPPATTAEAMATATLQAEEYFKATSAAPGTPPGTPGAAPGGSPAAPSGPVQMGPDGIASPAPEPITLQPAPPSNTYPQDDARRPAEPTSNPASPATAVPAGSNGQPVDRIVPTTAAPPQIATDPGRRSGNSSAVDRAIAAARAGDQAARRSLESRGIPWQQ